MSNTVTLLVQASLVFLHSSGVKFQVNASSKPQAAPEWVVATETYKAAFKQGLVYAINYVEPPAVQEAKPPANVGALGFAGDQKPTVDSLTKAGVSTEAAVAALNTMAENKAANDAPAELFKDLATTKTFKGGKA